MNRRTSADVPQSLHSLSFAAERVSLLSAAFSTSRAERSGNRSSAERIPSNSWNAGDLAPSVRFSFSSRRERIGRYDLAATGGLVSKYRMYERLSVSVS